MIVSMKSCDFRLNFPAKTGKADMWPGSPVHIEHGEEFCNNVQRF